MRGVTQHDAEETGRRDDRGALRGGRDGLPFKHAAALAGIGERTFQRWREQARTAPANSNLKKLERELERAVSAFMHTHMKRIAKAGAEGSKLWTASAWLLERRFPAQFSLVTKTELSAPKSEFDELDDKALTAKVFELLPKGKRKPQRRVSSKDFERSARSSMAPDDGGRGPRELGGILYGAPRNRH